MKEKIVKGQVKIDTYNTIEVHGITSGEQKNSECHNNKYKRFTFYDACSEKLHQP